MSELKDLEKLKISDTFAHETEDPKDMDDLVAGVKEKLNEDDKKRASNPAIARFLRAKRFNVDEATDAYAKYIAWKTENKLWDAKEKPNDEVVKRVHSMFSEGIHGFDKQGRPIYIAKFGSARARDLSQRVTQQELINYHIHDLEYTLGVICPEGAKKVKKPEHQALVNIVDLKGLSWEARFFLGHFQKISELDQVYYPSMMAISWVINAPAFFPYVYSICKPFLDPYIVARMRVFSEGQDYKTDILKEIDADQLPAEYGGTCKAHKSCLPETPDIDWAAIDAKKCEEAGKRMKLMNAEIPAGESRVIQKVIKGDDVSQESPLSFECFFKTTNKDIRFSIEFNKLSGEKLTLIAPETYQSQTVPVLKEVTINVPGTLRFVFDNTYSYFTPKYLIYGISMSTSIDNVERKEKEETSSS